MRSLLSLQMKQCIALGVQFLSSCLRVGAETENRQDLRTEREAAA